MKRFNKELVFSQHFLSFVFIFHFTQMTRCKIIFFVDLLLRAPELESERNSYCVPDYPGVSQNTSPHLSRLGPFTSPWEVGESRGEGAFLWYASTLAQSQILSARRGLEQWKVHVFLRALQAGSCQKIASLGRS